MLSIKNNIGSLPEGAYVWKKYEIIPPYLSFIGNEDFTLKTYNTTKNWNGILEYSTDALIWNTWDGTEISSSGNVLYLRGTGNTNITGSSANNRFVFTGTDALKIVCEGNIESLLDCMTVRDGGHPIMINDCYQSMFRGCTALTTAPELPATTLANNCYGYMFRDCTALTTAPSLPATTLAYGCYQNMFQGCTALTTAPELPVTTLSSSCYYSMFRGCTALTTAPSLPATTLANNCYGYMFYGCTALTTIPSLPATTLANNCYGYMFYGCSLIKLSTTQTGEYQIAYRIPTSGTGTTATSALAKMFQNTRGTFNGTPSINTTYYTSNTVV